MLSLRNSLQIQNTKSNKSKDKSKRMEKIICKCQKKAGVAIINVR